MSQLKQKVEILAPAGSFESMVAAIEAGADAVYMGGSRFGARAYAENPEGDRFLEAIDYAHLHGCKLYMTVNTLVKETELEDLYQFLLPVYTRGADAVIVQDMGVFDFIREHFPDLPIHASTQMTVTSYRSAKRLKELGAARVVTARELSLEEINEIHQNVDIEIESFVHGALCYCYSGQCLMSSMIGGRSGNRGRCAQPCRLPYAVEGQEKSYVLSLKDLCTLDILPEIIEAGVYSLKIEGRMKSPRYTAGVVSIYRKYVDAYLAHGKKAYKVEPADKKMLLELFDRGGFTEGYYQKHNGQDMVAIKEKPAFRQGNQELFDRLDEAYVKSKPQEPINGYLTVHQGEPLQLTLTLAEERDDFFGEVKVTGDLVQTAQNQPLTQEKIHKQMNKTGNTPFCFHTLTIDIKGNCFLPVQAMNELRRAGLEKLEEEILKAYRRQVKYLDESEVLQSVAEKKDVQEKNPVAIHVSLCDPATLDGALSFLEVKEIYLDSNGFFPEDWGKAVSACHEKGKKCALLLPNIFRKEAADYFKKHEESLKAAGFDAFVLRSMEEREFLKELGLGQIPTVFDGNLYQTNHMAAEHMVKEGACRLTYPLELNSRELEALKKSMVTMPQENVACELVAYGYIPVMVSAQCVCRTVKGCQKKNQTMFIKDRTGKKLPVNNYCQFCYNVIFNPSPLSLLGQRELVERFQPDVLRLSFTLESNQQVLDMIEAYIQEFIYKRKSEISLPDFTRGHLKRGVE